MLVEEVSPQGGPGEAGFVARLLRVVRLDATVFEAIEHDPKAMLQSLGVVAVQALATALPVLIHGRLRRAPVLFVLAVGGWLLFSAVVWLVGKLLHEHDRELEYVEVVKPLGFATAPGVLRVLTLVPFGRRIVHAVAFIWIIGATVVAVRHVYGFSDLWRAVAVVLIATFVIYIGMGVLVSTIFGAVHLAPPGGF